MALGVMSEKRLLLARLTEAQDSARGGPNGGQGRGGAADGTLVAGGFCYGRLLDESSIARESQNSPDSLWGRVFNLPAPNTTGAGAIFWDAKEFGPWPRVFNLWDRYRGRGQVKNLPPRRAAHFVPNTTGCVPFSGTLPFSFRRRQALHQR